MAEISFTSLQYKDFILLYRWMNMPHVMKWWGENRSWSLEDIAQKYETYVMEYKVLGDIKAPIHAFIIHIAGNPIGYIQYYNAYDFPREQGYEIKDLLESLASIDLYIGDVDFIGKGYAPKIINQFLTKYVWDLFDCCMVDPDLDNLSAIRAYEKAGFKVVREIPKTNSLLMLANK